MERENAWKSCNKQTVKEIFGFVKDIRNSYPNARQKENVPEEAYKWQKNTAIGI